ncbi:hypothetical protein [Paraburkholderia ginsengisoli]|uniref:XRE family transcriptional regulator n=1 Tax=Paraburkholderia ginsengisoli TaxID=311231 RepID=A0A7T4T8N8_9BURK|nr:hypothetical protein [Paraburkholderia ginsengisoli]QQC63874.1 XRE family transcriptional regulator [Paraburkholderia ginsengisoli]
MSETDIELEQQQRTHDATPQREPRAPMTDARRELHVKQALTRFVRNKNLPEELETLRYNLIVARVLSGMTAVEAAKDFGYANSTQLSLIESGERPTPKDHQFLRQAARIYSVSTDFLLGLSPHMEFDAKVSHQHALMRGTERILGGIAAQFTTAMIQFTNQTQPVPDDFERVAAATERIEQAIAVARSHGFDDVRGSATVVAAMDALGQAVEPIRRKCKQFRSIEGYFDDVREGKLQAIPYLTERYSPRDIARDLRAEWVAR